MTFTPEGRRARIRTALPLVILLVCAATYAAVTWYIALLRMESFNSSVDDLGFFNQLMWITIHGGPSAWATHTQPAFYAVYPWQTSTFLLLVPVYAAFPSPVTLLVVQSVGVALATIPIYFLARKYGLSAWAGCAFGVAFLLDFQVQSVTIFEFHLQSLYPLIFFSMILFYEYGRKKLFIVAGALSLMTNPLTLVLTLGFVGAVFLRESPKGLTISNLPPRLRGWLAARPFVSVLLLVAVVLFALEVWTGTLTGYASQSAAVQGNPQGYLLTIPTRLLYLAVTFAPCLAVAFVVRETQVLLIPLVAWVAVTNLDFIVPYIGRPDVIELVVVAFWGLMLFVSRHRGVRAVARVKRLLGSRVTRRFQLPGASSTNFSAATGVVVLGVVCIAMSPLSPWNLIPQTVADVNETLSSITTITPADRFLTSAISLIPSNASVLTQNNIPQLTGREMFQYPFPPKPAPNLSQADYIVSDESTNNFAQIYYSYLRPYVRSALESGEFGILAMGYGILLLERGFHGPPEMVGPLPYSVAEMSIASGYRTGSVAVHPPEVSPVFWYGPDVDVPAGNYTATYRLMIGPGATPSAPIVNLTVSNQTATGRSIYSEFTLRANQFPAPDVWTNVALNFTLSEFVVNADFPGLSATSATTIYFGGVTVTLAPSFST